MPQIPRAHPVRTPASEIAVTARRISKNYGAVEALRRRLQKNERKDEIHLNPANLTLSCGSESVVLLPAEVDILIAFARAPEHRLETWQLIELLNGEDANASKSSIEIRLTRLRKKMLACGANPHCITAIRGVGYQLCHVPVIF